MNISYYWSSDEAILYWQLKKGKQIKTTFNNGKTFTNIITLWIKYYQKVCKQSMYDFQSRQDAQWLTDIMMWCISGVTHFKMVLLFFISSELELGEYCPMSFSLGLEKLGLY